MLPMRHRSMLNCLGLFNYSQSKHSALVCVFPHGICPDALSTHAGNVQGLHAASTISVHGLDLRLITRVDSTLLQSAHYCHRTTNKVRAVQPHCGSRSLISVVPSIAGWSYQTRPRLRLRNQHQKHLFVKYFEICLCQEPCRYTRPPNVPLRNRDIGVATEFTRCKG